MSVCHKSWRFKYVINHHISKAAVTFGRRFESCCLQTIRGCPSDSKEVKIFWGVQTCVWWLGTLKNPRYPATGQNFESTMSCNYIAEISLKVTLTNKKHHHIYNTVTFGYQPTTSSSPTSFALGLCCWNRFSLTFPPLVLDLLVLGLKGNVKDKTASPLIHCN